MRSPFSAPWLAIAGFSLVFGVVTVRSVVAVGQTPAATQPSNAKKTQTPKPAPPDPTQYVGENTCTTCHQTRPTRGARVEVEQPNARGDPRL